MQQSVDHNATRNGFRQNNPCPASHPDLGGPYYGNQYWCYVDDTNHALGICNMHSSGVPPPEGGTWGANQPDCHTGENICTGVVQSVEDGRLCDENTGDLSKDPNSKGYLTVGECANAVWLIMRMVFIGKVQAAIVSLEQ